MSQTFRPTARTRIVQPGRPGLALVKCCENVERNGAVEMEHRLVDWMLWDDAARYDRIAGSGVLHTEAMYPHLERIFEGNHALGGHVLLADPFRAACQRLLETMGRDG